jgi:hypothetical protein
MFATPDDDAVPPDTSATIPGGRSGTGRGRESLALLAERVRPTAASRTRLLPVDPALAALLPEGGLRRGATIVVATRGGAGGGISLSVALLAAASAGGSWCAAVGLPDLGAVALADLGIDLGRFALVHSPGPAWAEATATLFDGIEAVLLCPPFPPRPAMARRLVARARDRHTVLVVVPGRAGWPEPPDVHLAVDGARWDGIGQGTGHLRRRRLTVTATGRRSATRPRRHDLWLPSPAGTVDGVDGADR